MQHYMIEPNQILDTYIEIGSEDFHHIFNVMRKKNNDKIICVDSINKQQYLCEIVDDKKVKIVELLNTNNELKNDITLVVSLLSFEKYELVIQKACELGVSKFIPIITKHSIIKYDKKKIDKKLIRWNKIIKEACEQSQRNTLMKIEAPIKFEDVIKYKEKFNALAYEKADCNKKIKNVFNGASSCLLMIGPEGGFHQEEVDYLVENGFETISLGKRILRSETAVISALSILSDLIEE